MSDEFKSLQSIEEQNKKPSKDYSDIKEMLKNTLIMLLIALVAGGLLGVVYVVTKEPIGQMEIATKQNACRKVFPTAVSFSDNICDPAINVKEMDIEGDIDIAEIYEAKDADNSLLGYVFFVVTHDGYGGDIEFALGIDMSMMINGVNIISTNESPGLGANAKESLCPQFLGKKALKYEVVKNGAILEEQVDAISGATITSRAVTNGVNGALTYMNLVFITKDGGVDYEPGT